MDADRLHSQGFNGGVTGLHTKLLIIIINRHEADCLADLDRSGQEGDKHQNREAVQAEKYLEASENCAAESTI